MTDQLPGRTVVADRVITKLAEYAATQVPGICPNASVLQKATGRGLPRASARRADDRARLSVDVAVLWPAPVDRVALAVRDAVRQCLGSQLGLQVVAVDVAITAVLTDDPRSQPERRVQ